MTNVYRANDPDAGVNGQVSYSLSARSKAEYGHLFSIDTRSGMISQREPIDFERHHDPVTLVVVADDQGDASLPATAQVMNVKNVLFL